MGPLRKNLGSRIPNAAASSNSANSNADVTLQSLAAAYQDLTARLSALEQLQLENARLLELTKTQANEIDSLRAQLAAQTAGPLWTPQTVSSPSLGTAASSWATVASRGSKNKLRRRAAAARGFQPVTGEQGFEYIYIPRSRKMTYTEARRRLGRLGVDTWRVLDVSFPAHSVVGLLVHLQYKPALVSLLEKAKIKVLDQFDPLDPDNVADPAFSSASLEVRQEKMAHISNERCLRTLERLRYPVAVAVSRFFLANAMVSDEAVSDVLAAKQDRPAFPRHRDQPDDEMLLDHNTCRYNVSSVSATGMVPAPSSPLVSSGSHGSHGPSTHSLSSSSSIPLTIGLWNANGLQESTAEDLLRHCQSFSLVFITETWLLPPHRIRTSWTQFNLCLCSGVSSVSDGCGTVPGSYQVCSGSAVGSLLASHLPVFAPFLVQRRGLFCVGFIALDIRYDHLW
ncbi:hypothetical protein G6F57_014232 [Rhizopus arrhizus]|nr:hypothetical protein G6F63_012468 [Rhizopus arrhizus]KAG1460967.1 hypothetical protein G6F57_014232 [Rhizopus arrhizus]